MLKSWQVWSGMHRDSKKTAARCLRHITLKCLTSAKNIQNPWIFSWIYALKVRNHEHVTQLFIWNRCVLVYSKWHTSKISSFRCLDDQLKYDICLGEPHNVTPAECFFDTCVEREPDPKRCLYMSSQKWWRREGRDRKSTRLNSSHL